MNGPVARLVFMASYSYQNENWEEERRNARADEVRRSARVRYVSTMFKHTVPCSKIHNLTANLFLSMF